MYILLYYQFIVLCEIAHFYINMYMGIFVVAEIPINVSHINFR